MNYILYPDCTPSPMEKIIIDRLRSEDIYFVREISFKGCLNPKTGQNLRYDFYVPVFNLIIEYDGKDFHKNAATKERDAIKDKFAKLHCIRMYRISGGIEYIDAFFSGDFWKGQIKRKIIHHPKIKQKTWRQKLKEKQEKAAEMDELNPIKKNGLHSA